MKEPVHPAFDSEEAAILSQITEEAEAVSADDAAPGATPAATTEATPAEAQPVTTATTEAAATPAVQPPADAAKAEADAAKPAVAQPAEPPQGDKTAALRAARRAEKRLREENDRLKADLEAARKAAPPAATELTDEELASLKEDFPAQYKLYAKQKELEQRIAATPQPQAQSSEEFQPIEFRPDVQELVDQVPDLLAWQHDPTAQDKLKRAIAYDTALEHDPDWIGKPVVERYAEAVARTKRAFGAATPPPAKTDPPVPRQDPAAVIASLEPAGPKGISDFGGGQPASAPAIDFNLMTDEEILARLPATN